MSLPKNYETVNKGLFYRDKISSVERMIDLIERTLHVELDPGLQARPAAQFVQEATKFSANIYLEKDSKKVNAKSIMGLMSLAIAKGEEITLIAEGKDEEEALDYLVRFIKNESV